MRINEARNYVADHIRCVSFYEIDSSNFEELVNSYFDVDFDFFASGERFCDSYYTFHVDAKDATLYPLKDEWWHEHSAAYAAFSHLCKDGVIPPGKYSVMT